MTYGFGLLVDELTGDLDVTGNDFNFLENTGQSLRQRLSLRLNTQQGEWEYNTEFGLPVRKILSLSGLTDKAQVEAEFITQINLEPDVTSIKRFQTEFNVTTRKIEITRIEVYHDNELYTLSLVAPNATKYSYPEPVPIAVDGICTEDPVLFPPEITELHRFINEEMIITGDATWWNLWTN